MTKMEQDIIDFINLKNNIGITFAQLSKNIDGFNGDMYISDKDTNVILWVEISKEATQAIENLVKTNKILVDKTSPLCYYIDGMIPNIKLAKKNKKYKKLHWLPVAIYLIK